MALAQRKLLTEDDYLTFEMKATASIDRREKWADYQRIQTLREYLIVDQDESRIEVRQQENLREWSITLYEPGDVVELACLDGLKIPVDDLYRDLPPPVPE